MLCAGLDPRHSLYGPWAPWVVCIRSKMIAGDGSWGWVDLQVRVLYGGEWGRFVPCEGPASPSPPSPGSLSPMDIFRESNTLSRGGP